MARGGTRKEPRQSGSCRRRCRPRPGRSASCRRDDPLLSAQRLAGRCHRRVARAPGSADRRAFRLLRPSVCSSPPARPCSRSRTSWHAGSSAACRSAAGRDAARSPRVFWSSRRFVLLAYAYVLPGLAWLHSSASSFRRSWSKGSGIRKSFGRSLELARSDFVHVLGGLCALVIIVVLSQGVVFPCSAASPTQRRRPPARWRRSSSAPCSFWARRSSTATKSPV